MSSKQLHEERKFGHELENKFMDSLAKTIDDSKRLMELYEALEVDGKFELDKLIKPLYEAPIGDFNKLFKQFDKKGIPTQSLNKLVELLNKERKILEANTITRELTGTSIFEAMHDKKTLENEKPHIVRGKKNA